MLERHTTMTSERTIMNMRQHEQMNRLFDALGCHAVESLLEVKQYINIGSAYFLPFVYEAAAMQLAYAYAPHPSKTRAEAAKQARAERVREHVREYPMRCVTTPFISGLYRRFGIDFIDWYYLTDDEYARYRASWKRKCCEYLRALTAAEYIAPDDLQDLIDTVEAL